MEGSVREQDIMAIEVTVSPEERNGEVECTIQGHDVVDDAIWLEKDRTFDIAFNLADDSGWSWDVKGPFCARIGKCPPIGSPQHGLLKVTGTPTAKRFTVQAQKTGARKIFHYRLIFSNGKSCDPIIIRD